MRQIVLDTETTGLLVTEGHRIIEIGCIELIDRKFTGRRYHQYINPERDIDEGARNVHGISGDFLAKKPVFSEIAQEFIDFISGAELIIHNAPFDIGFINYELKLLKKFKPILKYCRVIDTLALARQLHIGQRNGLDALCKRYSIDNSRRELHGALLDASLLAQVYLVMTGGQGSLFDDSSITNEVTPTPEILSPPTNHLRHLCVIKASPDELLLHQEQLQKMSKKGKCLWLDLEKDFEGSPLN